MVALQAQAAELAVSELPPSDHVGLRPAPRRSCVRNQIRLEYEDLGIPGLGEFEWQGNRAPIRREDDMVAVRCFACGWGHIYSHIDFLRVTHEGRL